MTYDAKRYASNVVERIRLGGEDSVALVEGAIRGGYEAGRAERPALHPTTRALLAAKKARHVLGAAQAHAVMLSARNLGPSPTMADIGAARDCRLAEEAAYNAWLAAGCPDADGEP